MNLQCVVIDDEPFAVNLLEEFITRVPFLTLMGKCYNAMEALQFLKEHKADLVFVDINMPNLSGMQLASLFDPGQLFIFTTAYSEYAVESYERNATDYLLKPITFDRFLKSVNKVKERFVHDSVNDSSPRDEFIYLKTGKAIVRTSYDQIQYIEALKDYMIFYTTGERHLVYKRMKDLEESLPNRFVRVHNSYIINLQHFHRFEDNHVLSGKLRIPVSEKYRDRFLTLVNAKLL